MSDWGVDSWPEPAWPGSFDGQTWDQAALEARYAPRIAPACEGIGVHCGEGGAYSRAPHSVFLAWLRDVLNILGGAGIGFACGTYVARLELWTADGPMSTKDWRGYALDRELLDLLRRT